EQFDSSKATEIVQYLLVYNSFKEDRLDDYQSTKNNTGWTPDIAFRRRTAFYDGFYHDNNLDGEPIIAIADNRNNSTGALDGNYDPKDFNNKYITYFTNTFIGKAGLLPSDYEYFFPQSIYTGFNVLNASVVKRDVDAENGVIDVIDRVVTPPLSIDQYLKNHDEYQSFKELLDRFVQYIPSEEATQRHNILTGSGQTVYVKAYSPLLTYSPNNENFLKEEVHDGQMDCW